MPKTKISEFSATPGNNTDIDGINISEGCAPSGINDAIRELMAQLKDFQAGTAGDSFNGPVGTTTAAAGAFTTISASGAVTLSGGTANGIPYLNGSKVLTTGTGLQFDGSNLGLGVTPSAYTTGKAFVLNTVGNAVWGLGSNSFQLASNYYWDGSYRYANNGFANRYDVGSSTGIHAWFTAPSGTAGNAISFTQAMTLDSSGNLLVGLTSTAVGGDTKMVQAAGWIAPRSTAVPGGGVGGSTLYAKERVYFGDNTGWTWDWYTVNTSGTTFRRFYYTDGGAAYNATGTWGSISDAKLKENVVDATPKLEKLTQVRVVNYNRIGESKKELGVIAQELEQIFPGMVEETPDRDAEGNDLGTTTKAVKYSVFVPMLIKAMQEMKGIVDAQAARIAALEAK